jgi:hypothetical protein
MEEGEPAPANSLLGGKHGVSWAVMKPSFWRLRSCGVDEK